MIKLLALLLLFCSSVFASCTITTTSPLLEAKITWQPATNISQTIATSGCASPAFSASAGSLPPGLSVASSTGIISGVGTNAGTYSFTIAVRDANGNQTRAYLWTITAVYPAFTFTADHTQVCANYGNGTTHCAYRQSFPNETPLSSGTIRWVDANRGSDSNPCFQSQPCLTIGHAYGLSTAGDSVYVNAGTYQEQLTFNRSGSPGNQIIVSASPGYMWQVLVKRSDFQIQATSDAPVIDMTASYNTVNGLLIQGSMGSQFGSSEHSHETCILTSKGLSGLVISNNTCYNAYHVGLKGYSGVTPGPAIWDGNIVYNCGSSSSLDHGIYISHTAGEGGLTLTRNITADNAGAGIQLYAGVSGPVGPAVMQNFSSNNGHWGIVTNSSNGTYQYNMLVANHVDGLNCFRSACTRNVFLDSIIAFNMKTSYTEDTGGGTSNPGPNTNDYNVYWTQPPHGVTNFVNGAHNQTTNPNLNDSGSNDYRLTSATPVRCATCYLEPLIVSIAQRGSNGHCHVRARTPRLRRRAIGRVKAPRITGARKSDAGVLSQMQSSVAKSAAGFQPRLCGDTQGLAISIRAFIFLRSGTWAVSLLWCSAFSSCR